MKKYIYKERPKIEVAKERRGFENEGKGETGQKRRDRYNENRTKNKLKEKKTIRPTI